MTITENEARVIEAARLFAHAMERLDRSGVRLAERNEDGVSIKEGESRVRDFDLAKVGVEHARARLLDTVAHVDDKCPF
jgi:hypothetical protein